MALPPAEIIETVATLVADVGTITGYTDLLQEQGLAPEQLHQFLKRLQSGSNRLGRLVEDFLFLVSLEVGEAQAAFTFQRDLFNGWPVLIDHVLQKHADKAKQHKVTFVANVASDIPETMLHPGYIEDAVGRLVDNAIKFTLGKSGTVEVDVAHTDGGVQVCVKDEGIGIAEEHMPRLFQSFQQIDREMHEQQGAGVGLAIVKGIVDLHHGKVEATSQAGQGSAFCLWLPLVEE